MSKLMGRSTSAFRIFQRKGWVSNVVIDTTGLVSNKFVLTEDGKKYFSIGYSYAWGNWLKLKLEKIFMGVTGIKMMDNNTSAEVQYTWKYKPNDVIEALKHLPKFRLQTETVRFSLFDDGWRLNQEKQ